MNDEDEDEKYNQENYFISKDIITILYSSIYSNEYGLPERINIKHLKGNDKNYNKTFIKDYFDFIQNFPNEQYLTNISLFNWWFKNKSKLFYKLNFYKPVSFQNLLNKERGACRNLNKYTSGKEIFYIKDYKNIHVKDLLEQMNLLQKLDIYKGSNDVKEEELNTLIETKTINKEEKQQILDFKKMFPNDLISIANKLREVIEEHIEDLRTTIFKPRNEEYLEPNVIPPDGWTWRSSSGYGGKHYYLDTLDIKKDFEIKSQFFLIKFDKDDEEHSMYLPFPKGLSSLDKSIYYTRDNYHYIKKMKFDWKNIQKDIYEIEKYLNVQERQNPLWKEHFNIDLKWKREMFIMFEILSKKGFTTIDGDKFVYNGPKNKEDKRRHPHYERFKSDREDKKEQLLKDKLDVRMKNTYLKNIKGEIIPGENTTLEICKKKFEEFTKHKWSYFIKVLDIFLLGKNYEGWKKINSKKFRITSIEIKDIYFENVREFTNQTDLIKRNITLGEVKVPCLMYPRPLKPPSSWNNTWIRCPLDKREERNKIKYDLGRKGTNVYQDTYDAWYLKDEYIENVIKHYGLKNKITSLKDFEKCLKKRITVNEDIDKMYPEFDEDKSEKNVVKGKKHKIIIKQEKFVKKLEGENEIIATLVVNYKGIKDIFKQVPILQDEKKMSITQYEEARKNLDRGKLIGFKTVQTKDTIELLILFLLWGNKEFNEPRYFRNTPGGKINTYGYKKIYNANERTWVIKSKNRIKKLEKIEIGRIWYNLYQKIEEFDLLKRKDTKSNYELEVVINQFKEKDSFKDFKSIKEQKLFKKLKDEAHIYLTAADKKYIIDYFDYLKIHYYHLKQILLDEQNYLRKLNGMNPEQLDKQASSVAIGSSKKKKEKIKPKITAEQEIKLDIVYNKYKGEHKYLTDKWRDFIKDATSTLVKRKVFKDKIDKEIDSLKEFIKKKQEDFNTNRKNYMPTKEFMDLKKEIDLKRKECKRIQEKMEKLKENSKLQTLLKEVEQLKKNLSIAIDEHDEHRINKKRKVTYPQMLKSHERFEEAQKKYNDEINKIPLYHLHLACEAQVGKLEDQIKTSFSQYIEKHIMKPTRLLRQKEERRDWLFLLLAPNDRNKLAFSKIYKKQYEKLRNLYFNMKQIQDRLVILRNEENIEKLESEMKEFQKKYKRFKAEEHYFTT